MKPADKLLDHYDRVAGGEPPRPDRAEYQCESCNVVFRAPDAAGAYRKAIAWGLAYAAEPPDGLRLLGVSHLTTVGDELGDGTEICSRLYQASDVWGRICQHLVQGSRLGFFTPDDPGDDLEAWCGECDRVLDRCGEWNEESEAFAGVTLVCDLCFEAARKRNARRGPSRPSS